MDEVNASKVSETHEQNTKDTQLQEALKLTEVLSKQVATLKESAAAQLEAHNNELKQLKFNTSLNHELGKVNARNFDTVKPLLKTFLDKAELDTDGSIKGLADELKKLASDKATSFLFESSETKLKGLTPESSNSRSAPAKPLSFGQAITTHLNKQLGAK